MDELETEINALLGRAREAVSCMSKLITCLSQLKQGCRDGHITEEQALQMAKEFRDLAPPEFPSIDLLEGKFLPQQQTDMN